MSCPREAAVRTAAITDYTLPLQESMKLPLSEGGSVVWNIDPIPTVTLKPIPSSSETGNAGARRATKTDDDADEGAGLGVGQKVGIGVGAALSMTGLVIVAVVALMLRFRRRIRVARRAGVEAPGTPSAELQATEAFSELSGRAAEPWALRSELEGATAKVIYGEDTGLKLRGIGSTEGDGRDEAAENGDTGSKVRCREDDGGREDVEGRGEAAEGGNPGCQPRGVEGDGSEEGDEGEKARAELPA